MAVKISRRLMNRPANISAFLLAGFLPLQVFALPALYQQQQPLVVGWDTANSSWTDPSHVDETGNLIFRSVNGLLRHAPNALYRNGEPTRHYLSVSLTSRCLIHQNCSGHSIVPGTVTPGTLLYHGTRNILGPPAGPEWVSFDPEHSYMFGMRLYTWVVQTPLKILYLDGSRYGRDAPRLLSLIERLNVFGAARRTWSLEPSTRRRFFCTENSVRGAGCQKENTFRSYVSGAGRLG